jgi:hypothetical protein
MHFDPNEVVELEDEHPRQSVADHEVLLSFNSDDFAEVFGYWWAEKGKASFLEYLEGWK